MTKYECSHIVGIRAKQLNDGAPMLIQVAHENLKENFLYIASKELQSGKLVVSLRRPLPNERYYDIKSSDLFLPDDLGVFIDMWEQQC